MSKTLCRHCGGTWANRPKGLCWSCYRRPGVRQLYPPVSKFGRRYHDEPAGGATPLCPTDAPPGSAEKVLVLAERAARGELLFHPLDAAWSEASVGRFTLPVGSASGSAPSRFVMACAERGCFRGRHALGLCRKHYLRAMRRNRRGLAACQPAGVTLVERIVLQEVRKP